MTFMFTAVDTGSGQQLTHYISETMERAIDAGCDWMRDYWTQNGAPPPEPDPADDAGTPQAEFYRWAKELRHAEPQLTVGLIDLSH